MNPYAPRSIDRPTDVPLDRDADLSVLDETKIFAAPGDPALWPRWREQLHRWRVEAARRIRYDGSRYESEPPGPFVVDVACLWDELLYDHHRATFTVERYLAAAEREFGGIDGVVLWHAYPLIGIDGWDQFAYYRDVPELPDVIARLQQANVRVYVAIYPWEPAATTAVTDLVKWSGADGVFLDTAKEGSTGIRDALDAVRPGLGSVAVQNLLFRLSATPGAVRWTGRPHGADTDEVLAELGYSPDDVAALRSGGAV